MSDLSTDVVYEAVVDLLIELKSEELIENENYKHARTLIKALVGKQKADGYIGIFTEKLDARGFAVDETLNAFKKQLDLGVKIRIIFQKSLDKNEFFQNPFYKEVMSNVKYQDLIEVRVLKPEHSHIQTHMVTPNSKAFRIETDHLKTKALASFNNKLGVKVREKFDELFTPQFSDPVRLH